MEHENRRGALPWPVAVFAIIQLLYVGCRAEARSAALRYASWLTRRWGSPATWTRPRSPAEWLDMTCLLDSAAEPARRHQCRWPRAPPRHARVGPALEVSPATAAHWLDTGPRSPMHCADSTESTKASPYLLSVFMCSQ